MALRPYNHDSLLVVAEFPLPDSMQIDENKHITNNSTLKITVYLQSNIKLPFAEYNPTAKIITEQAFGKFWGKITTAISTPAESFTIEFNLTISKLRGYSRVYSAPPASYRWNLRLTPPAVSYSSDSVIIENAHHQVLIDEYSAPIKPSPPPYFVFRRKQPTLQVVNRNKVLATPAVYFRSSSGCAVLKNSLSDTLMYSFFSGDADFPDPTTLSGLINPLTYICSPSEMRYFQEYPSKKVLDDFWLEVGGNAARARERIAEFYERVFMSNHLFTDFGPGYLTDRGMIWCVFGKPDAITYRPNKEVWFYESIPGQTNSVSFTFVRYPHQLAANHFELVRESGYETIWFTAINNWRNGIIKK